MKAYIPFKSCSIITLKESQCLKVNYHKDSDCWKLHLMNFEGSSNLCKQSHLMSFSMPLLDHHGLKIMILHLKTHFLCFFMPKFSFFKWDTNFVLFTVWFLFGYWCDFSQHKIINFIIEIKLNKVIGGTQIEMKISLNLFNGGFM